MIREKAPPLPLLLRLLLTPPCFVTEEVNCLLRSSNNILTASALTCSAAMKTAKSGGGGEYLRRLRYHTEPQVQYWYPYSTIYLCQLSIAEPIVETAAAGNSTRITGQKWGHTSFAFRFPTRTQANTTLRIRPASHPSIQSS